MNQQLETDWAKRLNEIVARLNPLHEALFGGFGPGYYWSCYQSEWATDILFSQPQVLADLYPRLIHHGMTTFGSEDVLRFLGKPVSLRGPLSVRSALEVATDLKVRTEGVRIKHSIAHNSVKIYDKAHTSETALLRVETTIHNHADLRVYRPKEGGPEEELAWRPLRKGIADLYRRAQVSHKCNERYLNALASVETDQLLSQLLAPITMPTTYKDKRMRALRPFEAEDMRLFAAVNRGEFVLNGLRNRDLVALYFATPALSAQEARRRSGYIGRKLRLLRAHGILQKVTGTHRYQVTAQGRKILTALLTAKQTPVNQLLDKAA